MDDDALEQIGENPEQVDGCELVCEDDEILIADPRQKTWYCLKKIGPMPLLCPGGFKTGKTNFEYLQVSNASAENLRRI